MLSKEDQQRYARHLALSEIGAAGQELLLNSKILVVGAGGLGCPVLQYLAAAGIGKIIIIDHDIVDLSNLQRQVLFTQKDIGRKKAEVARDRILQLNPHINVEAVFARLDHLNARKLVQSVDLVIDGSDNFTTRYLVNDACVLENKPWVFGSVLKYEGQLTVFNYQGGPSYRCLFPEVPENVPSCSDAGVLGALTGTIGAMMANEAIKIITGKGYVASGTLHIINLIKMEFQSLEFSRTEEYNKTPELKSEEVICDTEILEVDVLRFNELLIREILTIDLRETYEIQDELQGVLNIPLGELEERSAEWNTHKEVLLFCESGARSKVAAKYIRKSFPDIKIYHLKEGMKNFRAFQV